MTARDYIPQKGDRLRRNTFFTSLYPYNIEIEKITRSGHVHWYKLNANNTRDGHQGTISLTVLRKLYQLMKNETDEKTNETVE